MNFKLHSNRIEPIANADNFFSKPELLNQSIIASHVPTKCSAGCLALRIPDPPMYSLPAICAISKNGNIAAVGGRDVELYLWDTNTGALLHTIRGHDVCWTSSYANDFYVTVQEDSKVITWDQDLHTQRSVLGQPQEPLACCAVSLDDAYVVVGGYQGSVYAYSSNGNEVHHFAGGHVGAVQTVMCYAMEDGSHNIISCGTMDQTIVIWDLTSGERRLSVPVDELEHAKTLRYHIKDGTHVLVWCTDAVPFPNLVLVDTINQTKSSVYSHEGLVRHAVFNKAGDSIISCGSDGKIIVWESATLEARVTLNGHTGAVLCCSINNEGTPISSSGEDATIRVWSAEDGRQLQRMEAQDEPDATIRVWSAEDGRQLQRMEAQDEPVKMCTYAKKGSKILTCDATGRAYVWSSMSEVVLNLVRSAISMSNDSKLLLSGSNNGRVMLWDVHKRRNLWEFSHHTGRVESVSFNSVRDQTGKQINSFMGNNEPILNISFSPDDERLGGLSADGKLLIYMVGTSNRKPKLVLHSNIARIAAFVWSPNSKLLAGCGSDGCVLVWNAVSGSIFTVLEGTSAATCCAFDQIGKLVAVGTHMGATVLYNLETAELLSELRYNAGPVREVTFNQETSKLATICGRQAHIWDVATSKKIRTFDFIVDAEGDFRENPLNPYRTAVAHSGTILFDPESEAIVYDMVPIDDPLLRSYYLSDSRMVSSGTQNHKRFTVWSATGSTTPDKFHTTHDAITSCHFSNDDRLIVMGTQDGNIVVYDVQHNETVEVIAAHQNGPCRCVRLSSDNSEVLSCGADAKVILWDWRNRMATRIYSGHFISGNRVVSGDNHGMITIFDKVTGDSVQAIPLAHSKSVLSVSMSADGSTIASVGADDKVSIWSVEDGVELVSLTAAIESHPLYCTFSHDGNKLAVTESSGSIMIWNAIAGCQWYIIKEAHKGRVTSCTWSFDCRRFVTAGQDSILAVWDSESGAPLLKYDIATGPLTTCAVSPMGVYVAAGSSTGTLSVCSIPLSSKVIPEPSFLYHWMSNREPKVAQDLFAKLSKRFSTIPNVQDAQGWSLIHHTVSRGNAQDAQGWLLIDHTVSRGNAQVAQLILATVPKGSGCLGLTSAVPYTIQTHVKFHEDDMNGPLGESTEKDKKDSSALAHGDQRQIRRPPAIDLYSFAGPSLGTIQAHGDERQIRRPPAIDLYSFAGLSLGTIQVSEWCEAHGDQRLIRRLPPIDLYSFADPSLGTIQAHGDQRLIRRPHAIDLYSFADPSLGTIQAHGDQRLIRRPHAIDLYSFTGPSLGAIQAHGDQRLIRRPHAIDLYSFTGPSLSAIQAHGDQRLIRRPPAIDLYSFTGPSLGAIQVVGSPIVESRNGKGSGVHAVVGSPIVESRNGKGSGVHAVQGGGFFGSMMGMGKGNSQKKSSGRNSGRMSQGSFSGSANELYDGAGGDFGAGSANDFYDGAWGDFGAGSANDFYDGAGADFGAGSANDFYDGGGGDFGAGVQKSTKSFSQRIKKVAVELFTEKAVVEAEDIIINNSLALSLNSQSSECVRVILDAAAENKFLACLELLQLGELEVPVNVMKGLEGGIIRTAPIFTNVQHLWQSHFKGHEVKSGPQPYAHVKASMAYGTPTVRAVIWHKYLLTTSQHSSPCPALPALKAYGEQPTVLKHHAYGTPTVPRRHFGTVPPYTSQHASPCICTLLSGLWHNTPAYGMPPTAPCNCTALMLMAHTTVRSVILAQVPKEREGGPSTGGVRRIRWNTRCLTGWHCTWARQLLVTPT
eukprot:gene28270-31373_t